MSLSRPRLRLAVLGVLAGGLAFTGAGAAPAADGPSARAKAASSAATRASGRVTVDPLVERQLARSGTGKVAATITAWSQADLDEIQRIAGGTRLRALPMVLTERLTRAQLEKLRRSAHVRGV